MRSSAQDLTSGGWRTSQSIETLRIIEVAESAVTNKAAREIHQRLRTTLGERVEELTTGTIHSLCLQILRDFGEMIGLRKGFGIADETHQRLILKKLRVPPQRQGGMLTRFRRRNLSGYHLTESEESSCKQYDAILTSQHMIDVNGLLYHLRRLLDAQADVLGSVRKPVFPCPERLSTMVCTEIHTREAQHLDPASTDGP